MKVQNEESGPSSKTRFDYLNQQELIQRLREKIEQYESQLFFEKSKSARLKIRAKNQREELKEYAQRGSLKAICHNLEKAESAGMLQDSAFLKDFLATMSRNLNVDKHGKRYKPSQKLFYEVLSYIGGPRIVEFFAVNFGGPEIKTVYRWRNQNNHMLTGVPTSDNFKVLATIYAQYVEKTGRVPVERSEDETAIVTKVTYHEKTDTLNGFCGDDGPAHQCLGHADEVHVGDGEAGYNIIREAFNTKRIASYARAVLLNPLHPSLPKIAILIAPTCNRFDHVFVQRQWQVIDDLYKEHLEPVLGPLVGGSSDGDSRRRKLMLQLASCTDGSRHQPIPREEGFVLTCRKEAEESGGYVIRDLPDQDFIHNLLLHASRTITVGEHLAHLVQLEVVRTTFPLLVHGLSAGDLIRDDRQNDKSCEKVAFKRIGLGICAIEITV